MAVSWGFTMLLVVTIVALFTFSQPLFQLAIPEAVENHHTQTISSQAEAAAAVPQASHGSSWRRSQRWTRKLIQRRPPYGQSATSPVNNINMNINAAAKPRRSVLASFQSDRMVPTGPNPLHNSNRSQVIFP